MKFSEKAQETYQTWFKGQEDELAKTDPVFWQRFLNFTFGEVENDVKLDDQTRLIAILATLLGCQGIDEFKIMLNAALNVGVKTVVIKEIIYQATAYLGMGRVRPFFKVANEVFEKRGITLPVEVETTADENTRMKRGEEMQVEIFGEGMHNFANSGPEDSRHINKWLVGNCFGDYYTDKGLTTAQREMITFCYLFAQGGAEPQVIAHAKGNFNVGNDKDFLIAIVSQNVPFIGYPRALNAINCIRKAAE